jgi:uncharacterized protein YbjT (DUF2867 family)
MTQPLVLSVGAAGRFAGLVVPELARRGALVRGLVHNPANADRARANGAAEIAFGDLADPASLDAALQGVAGVFYIPPVFASDEPQLGLNMIAAAKRAGVRRFVFSSVIHPTLALENHLAKGPVESELYGSGMEYVVLHPATFFQTLNAGWQRVLSEGVLAEPFPTTSRLARVDYRDVAEAAAIGLTETRLNYGTFELVSDDWLNRENIAAIMSEALGRQTEAAAPTFEDWAARLRLALDDRQKSLLKRMYHHYGQHGSSGNSLTLRAILGRAPRTMRAFIEELVSRATGRKPTA